ncbi:phage/plasmid primase, P4 family [Hydrogenophaga sp.]|uniref:phage/plasmid primase, P4 family n=1 Tax=Hydrogenophaga sp. TaxID=1904254 RepID=UPI0035B2C8B2
MPAVGAEDAQRLPRAGQAKDIKSLEKTPSDISPDGVAYALKGWPTRESTALDQYRWRADQRLNVLLRTGRGVVAIDIDIGDKETAQAIERFIVANLGVQLPVRSRPDTGKRTMLLRVTDARGGKLSKRVIRLTPTRPETAHKAGAVEFLADGQQTVVAGRHPGGAFFATAWPGGVATLPTVPLEVLQAVWDELRNAYDPTAKPLGADAIHDMRAMAVGEVGTAPLVLAANAAGLVLAAPDSDGKVQAACPFAREHQSDPGGSGGAVILPPRTEASGQKHPARYHCSHTSCQNRPQRDFYAALGVPCPEPNPADVAPFALTSTPIPDGAYRDPFTGVWTSPGGQPLLAGAHPFDEPPVWGPHVAEGCPPLDTDDGMACRFRSWLNGRAMHTRGEWHVFTGSHWQPGDHAVKALLKTFAEQQRDAMADAYAKAEKAGVDQTTKAVQGQLRAAKSLLNQTRQGDVLRAAAVMLHHKADDLDMEHDLLCVPNGVVDLRTGRLLPPDPKWLFTRCAGVAYDAAASCPTWERFILEVFPAAGVARYVQRLGGYMLTGHMREEVMSVWYGSGANGKSVMGDILARVLGDFATSAQASLLVGRSPERGAASPELAMLFGRRLCYVNESKVGDRLNDSTVKQLVSPEKLSARRMYQEAFEFYPTAKVVLRTNNKPIVADESDGIWRRLQLLNFSQRFEGDRRDPGLLDKLKAELPGILAWHVRGSVDWYAEGLNPPESVKEATAGYRSDNDDMTQWLHARTIEGGATPAAELLEDFNRFAGLRTPLSVRRFSDMMKSRGHTTTHKASARVYALSLRNDTADVRAFTPPPPLLPPAGVAKEAFPPHHPLTPGWAVGGGQ